MQLFFSLLPLFPLSVLLYYFATVEEIKAAVYQKANEYHTSFLMNMEHDYGNPMLSIGMNYIRFAVEEMIFRGFLFQAICKTSVKQAIAFSSITFGLGHITNLLTGREIPATLLQLCYAAAIGFLFTIVLYKGKSIWPCIITHGVLNSLSAFVNTENVTMQSSIISSIILCIVSLAYAIYIIYISKEKNEAVA